MALRKAYVASVDQLTGIGAISLTDNRSQQKSNIKMLQPYAGRGWGIRAGIESDSGVLVDDNVSGETYVIGYLADPKFFNNLPPSEEDASTESAPKFKDLQEGEIVLQSRASSLVFMDAQGSIALRTADGMRFELSKATDTINQLSINHTILTEGSALYNGVVRRDTRTEEEKIDDLFISTLVGANFASQELTDIIGVDPQHRVEEQDDAIVGVFDSTEGTPSILELPGLKDIPQAEQIVTNILNPAVTEYRLDVNEFSDGISSINITEQTAEAQLEGRLPPNLASRMVFGTVVDNTGKLSRFDYVFGTGEAKGHGEIWKLPGLNETHKSVDFKIDSTIEAGTQTSDSQWTVGTLDRFNTATAFQLVMNSRGADQKGAIPDGSSVGSIWALQVDKEGLTKWNIPASTNLDNKEGFRAGRSLLWNMDGSMTLSVGKEDNEDLPSITGVGNDDHPADKVKFVNVLLNRKERSWTADFEGTVEWRLGKDLAGQSQMIQADGGLAFYYGKMIANETSIVDTINTAGVTAPSKSGNRIGTSISGRTEGSIELDIGTNNDSALQSVALNADGIMIITIGEDKTKESLRIDAAGSIKLQTVNGGHKIEMYSNQASGILRDMIRLQHGGSTQSLIQIDSSGVIILRNSFANSNIIMSALGDITLINATGTKISMSVDGTIGIGNTIAGIDISATAGVVLRTAGGSLSLNPAGKVEVAANAGLTVTGSQAHLNTTGVLFGAGAATSPYRVAICGGGLGIDPLSGDSQTGFSLLGAIG